MTILDTSGVFAASRVGDSQHGLARATLVGLDPPLVLSPFILAELDYMILRNMGLQAELALLADVNNGSYSLAQFSPAEVEQAAAVVSRYADLQVGLADASIVVLADRYHTRDVFTFDRRHFRALRTLAGEPFRLLPDDL